MAENPLAQYFEDLPDPREDQGKRHPLESILSLALLAVLSGAEGFADIERFGRTKEAWLKSFLGLPHGIPSHDTLGRVFGALDPDALEQRLARLAESLASRRPGRVVAMDGKTLRRSFDRAGGRAALHMLSAWADEEGVVLAQVACPEEGNELTALPDLLKLVDLKGAVVTYDALGCQREVAQNLTRRGADYVLALKSNHPTLYEEVRTFLDDAQAHGFADLSHAHHRTVEKDHGRVEVRDVWVTGEVDWLADKAQWAGLQSLAMVEAERVVNGQCSRERRYFLSSLSGTDAAGVARAVRRHWGIENRLHWSLDVGFDEDRSRIRQGHAAENFSRLKRLALNLLRREKSAPGGIKAKRLQAAWSDDYLLTVLRI